MHLQPWPKSRMADERTAKAVELEQKVALLEVECSSLTQELQDTEARARRWLCAKMMALWKLWKLESLLRLSLNKSSNLVLFDPQLLWGTKDEIQSIPPFKWFSLLLVPVPNSSPGSSQCLAL
ncbi:hypothetical protein L2E82_30766 [Cichorium intybus]|uniref:Uncharacterized protein n=1 Tax=Cichorium intybus TaxID=13427 RepID=A0ACB9D1K7_CICIN|nr:hypothetical protein L2E82_30766 [Cichorium intybus]